MRHAGPEALARLADVLAELRRLDGLTERRPGVFYRRSKAFLHFHADPAGLFADLKVDGAWTRSQVDRPEQRSSLIERVRSELTG